MKPNSSSIQTLSNLVTQKGIKTSILNLITSKPLIVPPTQSNPFWLLNLLPQNLLHQRFYPRILPLHSPQISQQPKPLNPQHSRYSHHNPPLTSPHHPQYQPQRKYNSCYSKNHEGVVGYQWDSAGVERSSSLCQWKAGVWQQGYRFDASCWASTRCLGQLEGDDQQGGCFGGSFVGFRLPMC
ncbi:hypothetical protein OIU76_010590 [Salix suchowensis]|nr:hypothetical protein OIU76_010590 [Salix suchowensis]KAJ6363611.1 hypothetical protein OIU78_003732 [Salix suchowensis]